MVEDLRCYIIHGRCLLKVLYNSWEMVAIRFCENMKQDVILGHNSA